MQDGLVARVSECLEGLDLRVTGIGQQAQCLVRVGRDDDPVEPRDFPTGVTDLDSLGSPGDVGDGARPADVRQHFGETLDIRARSAGDGVPLGFNWVHIPIVDERGTGDYRVINRHLDEAAAVLADPKNYPIYFHCHHGINRASMVQMAYRTKYCGWTLEQATKEIEESYGLVAANHGPDYRSVESFYTECVLPFRQARAPAPAPPSGQTAQAAGVRAY